MRKVIYDSTGTAIRVLHARPEDPYGDFAIETIEDVEPIIDEVKELSENHRSRGDMKHVARVPLNEVERAMREGWFNDPQQWRKWCNDGQNRDFRVWKGRC